MDPRLQEIAEKLVHGPRPVVVELREYDPRWAELFEREQAQLRRALGSRAMFAEHIGSTAVPGLAAKPIIDIVVGVADPDHESAYLPPVTALGYDLRVREPGHRCLRREPSRPDELPINLHCYAPDSDEVRRYRLLRDRLRAHAGDRARYEQAKRSLAGREWRTSTSTPTPRDRRSGRSCAPPAGHHHRADAPGCRRPLGPPADARRSPSRPAPSNQPLVRCHVAVASDASVMRLIGPALVDAVAVQLTATGQLRCCLSERSVRAEDGWCI